MQETVGSCFFDFALLQFFCSPFPDKFTFFGKMTKKMKKPKIENLAL